MLTARIIVAKFVRIIGRSEIKIPYVSQRSTPVQKIRYIPSDRSFADFVFQVLMAWGKKAAVVQKPAASPIIVINSMCVWILDDGETSVTLILNCRIKTCEHSRCYSVPMPRDCQRRKSTLSDPPVVGHGPVGVPLKLHLRLTGCFRQFMLDVTLA
jgi:hypothetical protein